MKIEIDDLYNQDFVYSIPKYMYNSLKDKKIDSGICKRFKDEFNIDINNIFLFSLKTLDIRHIQNKYIIEINRNKFYKNMNVEKLINLITYGSRTVKGYTGILKLFKLVQESIPEIYERWLVDGY